MSTKENTEQLILPACLRTDLRTASPVLPDDDQLYQHCTTATAAHGKDKTESRDLPYERLPSLKSRHGVTFDMAIEENTEKLLGVVIRDKISMLQQLRLERNRNLRLDAKLGNLKSIDEKLSGQLCDNVSRIASLEPPPLFQRDKAELERRERALTEALRASQNKIEDQRSEISDLTKIALCKDAELKKSEARQAELQHQLDDSRASERMITEKLESVEYRRRRLSRRLQATDRVVETLRHEQEQLKKKSHLSQIEKEDAMTARVLRNEVDALREMCTMLESCNRHLVERNRDLVEAYWPLMGKLKRLNAPHHLYPDNAADDWGMISDYSACETKMGMVNF